MFKIKKFNANTQKAINKIYSISEHADDVDKRAKLNCIRTALNKNSFIKEANTKQQKVIEARMFSVLDKIFMSLQQRDDNKFYGYCDIALNLINGSRAFGKEIFTNQQLRQEEGLMESKSAMEKEYTEIARLEKYMKELLNQGKTAVGINRQKLSDEYANCLQQKNAHEAMCEEYRKVYNQNCAIINDIMRGEVYQQVPRVISLDEFQKVSKDNIKKKLEFDKANAAFDQQLEMNASAMNVEKSGKDYAAAFEQAVNNEIMNDTFKATGGAKANIQSEESEFERLLRENEEK